jgi:hypothetical protein
VQGDVLSEGSAQTPYTWHLDSRGGTTDYSATAPRAWFDYFKGKKRISSAPFNTKNFITLPRQARDKNKGKLKKETRGSIISKPESSSRRSRSSSRRRLDGGATCTIPWPGENRLPFSFLTP